MADVKTNRMYMHLVYNDIQLRRIKLRHDPIKKSRRRENIIG